MTSTAFSANSDDAAQSRDNTLRSVVLFSIATTLAIAVASSLWHVVSGQRFLLVFVLMRWTVVFALLLAPVAKQLFRGLPLPHLIERPWVALLLTCESIAIDIISAQTHW